jgi:hypothetical protein
MAWSVTAAVNQAMSRPPRIWGLFTLTHALFGLPLGFGLLVLLASLGASFLTALLGALLVFLSVVLLLGDRPYQFLERFYQPQRFAVVLPRYATAPSQKALMLLPRRRGRLPAIESQSNLVTVGEYQLAACRS